MDCEKFDQHVIDALYEELDELTNAALKRHVEGCTRCANILIGLRATREVGILPIEEPSEDLEARILDAVATAQRKAPWPRKLLRGLAWAGSHAMRPQLAMAALFFLVIGSSLLLLRPKPASVAAPFRVTENGAPSPDQSEPVTAAPIAMAAPTTAATAAAEAPLDAPPPPAALAEARQRDEQQKDKGSARGDKADQSDKADKDLAKIALADARAVRASAGCPAAISKFDEVGTRFPGSGVAADAMWEEAACYKSMGELDKARQLYLALKSGGGGYRDRAEQELAADSTNSNLMQNQVAARAAAGGGAKASVAAAPAPAAPPPAAAEASKVAPAKPTSTMGSSGKAVAAPKRAPTNASDNAAGF